VPTTTRVSQIGAHYDAITEAWRLVMGEAFHYGVFEEPDDDLERATRRLNERMLAAAPPLASTSNVLDVGCGIGGPARWLSRETGASVVGLSNSEKGVDVARGQTPPALSERVTFAVADAQDNGLPDERFDLAWVMESSHLMPHKARLVSECARVLRPGGRLVLCDLMIQRPFELAEVFAQHKAFKCLDRVFGKAKMETVEVYRNYCDDAGLVAFGSDDLTAATRRTLVEWAANVEAHRDALLDLIGEAATDDFAAACEILLRYWDEGRMGYGLIWAEKP
jgi:cyclopropane fatty-acyl-phospholipid synthase-like methyltransferase